MNKPYTKDFPRGTTDEILHLSEFFPIGTEHLNTVSQSLQFIRDLKEIISDADNSAREEINDIEIQGQFSAFLNLCFLDFVAIHRNALAATHLWDDIFSLRQGYLLISEALKTYSTHSKSLKILADKTSPEAVKKFKDLTLQIKHFKKEFEYDKNILEVRNYTIGHIESDPLIFFDKLSKFDDEKAFAALKAFVSILVSMLKLSDFIFVNYTKKVIREFSFGIAGLKQYSVEIDKLLDLLSNQTINDNQNGS